MMRCCVVIALLVCWCGAGALGVVAQPTGVNNTFTVTGADPSNQFYVFTENGVMSNDPALTLTGGVTYTFVISETMSNHPFAFTGTEDGSPAAVPGASLVANPDCTSANNAYVTNVKTNPCVITYAAPAAGGELWYRCAYHAQMKGKITVQAAPTATPTPTSSGATTDPPTNSSATTSPPTSPGNNSTNTTSSSGTTASPTTESPTGAPTATPTPTSSPTPIAGATLTGSSFRITGNNAALAYIFTDSTGATYLNPTLNVTAGTNVTLLLEFRNNHPLAFSTNGDPANFNLTTDIPDGLNTYTFQPQYCNTTESTTYKSIRPNTTTVATNPCVLTIQVPTVGNGESVLYYRCVRHPAMVGRINVNPPTGGTTIPPSGTTNPPKGGNLASSTTGAGFGALVAVVVSIIVAIMA